MEGGFPLPARRKKGGSVYTAGRMGAQRESAAHPSRTVRRTRRLTSMQNTKSLLIATLSSAILIAAVPFTGSAVGSGSSEKVLYSFSGGSDGANPAGALVADKAGNLYGTTSQGGSSNCAAGCGIVFELTPPATRG